MDPCLESHRQRQPGQPCCLRPTRALNSKSSLPPGPCHRAGALDCGPPAAQHPPTSTVAAPLASPLSLCRPSQSPTFASLQRLGGACGAPGSPEAGQARKRCAALAVPWRRSSRAPCQLRPCAACVRCRGARHQVVRASAICPVHPLAVCAQLRRVLCTVAQFWRDRAQANNPLHCRSAPHPATCLPPAQS